MKNELGGKMKKFVGLIAKLSYLIDGGSKNKKSKRHRKLS